MSNTSVVSHQQVSFLSFVIFVTDKPVPKFKLIISSSAWIFPYDMFKLKLQSKTKLFLSQLPLLHVVTCASNLQVYWLAWCACNNSGENVQKTGSSLMLSAISMTLENFLLKMLAYEKNTSREFYYRVETPLLKPINDKLHFTRKPTVFIGTGSIWFWWISVNIATE